MSSSELREDCLDRVDATSNDDDESGDDVRERDAKVKRRWRKGCYLTAAERRLWANVAERRPNRSRRSRRFCGNAKRD